MKRLKGGGRWLPLGRHVEDYMDCEVLPQVPDAKWFFEEGKHIQKKTFLRL